MGNWNFKSSTNQTPKYAQPGLKGIEKKFTVELKVLADVGLVGLPNSGKSTLLSVMTDAKPKIANYEFTTLKPNLGILKHRDFNTFVISDIPGDDITQVSSGPTLPSLGNAKDAINCIKKYNLNQSELFIKIKGKLLHI